MKTSTRLTLVILALPMLVGCYSITTVPVPATTPQREDTNVKGVVVRQAGGGEETVEFSEILEATWTPTSLSIVGVLDQADVSGVEGAVTRLFPISTMAGLRVRTLDAGKTSGIIGGVFLVTAAILAITISGTAGY